MSEAELSEESEIALAIQENTEGMDGILVGFVAVSEWMDQDGRRWLTVQKGTPSGGDVTPWQMRGYLNEALNHWPEPEEEDEEDA